MVPSAAAPRGDSLGSFGAILALAWPQVLTMAAQFLVAATDVVVAGHIGPEVQACLGLVSVSVFFFLVAGTAMASGAVAVLSQSLGAGRRRRVGRYVGLLLLLAVGCGGLSALAFGLFRGALLAVLQVPEAAVPVAGRFLGVYLYALPFYYLLLVSNAIFQSFRRVRVPLWSMALVAAANAVLDCGLGLGLWGLPRWGAQGLAWASVVSVGAGAALNLWHLWRRGLLRRAALPPWAWMRRAWQPLARYAWPAGMAQILWQGSHLVLFTILAALPGDGVTALAAFAAGMRIEALLFLPAYALSLTASILVGRALGAGRPALALAVARRILGLGCAVLGLGALLVWALRGPILALATPDPAVRAAAGVYLGYALWAVPFAVAANILGGVMTGAGATRYAMAAQGLAGWLVKLPLAWLLGHTVHAGAPGVWAALLGAHGCHFLLLLFALLRLDWRGHALRPAARRAGGGVPCPGACPAPHPDSRPDASPASLPGSRPGS